MRLKMDKERMKRLKYPNYVPAWYDPKISYRIMQEFGDKSLELKEYLEKGILPWKGEKDEM